jgi:hypothetical protein
MWMHGLQLLSHSVIGLQVVGKCGHFLCSEMAAD